MSTQGSGQIRLSSAQKPTIHIILWLGGGLPEFSPFFSWNVSPELPESPSNSYSPYDLSETQTLSLRLSAIQKDPNMNRLVADVWWKDAWDFAELPFSSGLFPPTPPFLLIFHLSLGQRGQSLVKRLDAPSEAMKVLEIAVGVIFWSDQVLLSKKFPFTTWVDSFNQV